MTPGKNDETGLFCNITSPVYNLSQEGYANFLHNQRLSETASPCILGGRVNQADVSNITNIFTTTSTPVNLEEDHPKQDFHEAVEKEFVQENSGAKQQQQQQQQMLPRQQAFSIHEITSVEKKQLLI